MRERPRGSCGGWCDNIEVKVTATGSSANYKAWQVSFRF
jgi:hypothetical protein